MTSIFDTLINNTIEMFGISFIAKEVYNCFCVKHINAGGTNA